MDSITGRVGMTAPKRLLFIALALLLAISLVFAMILTPTLGTSETDAAGETAEVVAGGSWSYTFPGAGSWSRGGRARSERASVRARPWKRR